jgi:aspartate 1-decarboxylase
VLAYCQMPAEEARNYAPSLVLLDENNDIVG